MVESVVVLALCAVYVGLLAGLVLVTRSIRNSRRQRHCSTRQQQHENRQNPPFNASSTKRVHEDEYRDMVEEVKALKEMQTQVRSQLADLKKIAGKIKDGKES